MSVFIDASVMVAMLAHEPESVRFAERTQFEDRPITSAIAIWETVRAFARVRGLDYAEARLIVLDFIETARLHIVDIGVAESDAAPDAHERYGKGRHAAALNMGNCFVYACAKVCDAELLFKGDDFPPTDLEPAV